MPDLREIRFIELVSTLLEVKDRIAEMGPTAESTAIVHNVLIDRGYMEAILWAAQCIMPLTPLPDAPVSFYRRMGDPTLIDGTYDLMLQAEFLNGTVNMGAALQSMSKMIEDVPFDFDVKSESNAPRVSAHFHATRMGLRLASSVIISFLSKDPEIEVKQLLDVGFERGVIV